MKEGAIVRSNKNPFIELVLCVLLGYVGVHRFYAGKVKSALLYLFTGGLVGIGWIVDIVILLIKCTQSQKSALSDPQKNTIKTPANPYAVLQNSSRPASQSSAHISFPDHYIVFDIETTGFSRTNDRIIEIAANKYHNGILTKRFHTYVNPGVRIPSGITRLTGIHNSDVLGAPSISQVKGELLAFFGTMVLVGHNINTFDIPFLEAQLGCAIPNLRIDTLPLAKNTFPGLPSYKLSVLDQVLQLGSVEHHRAGNDILVNNALLLACKEPQKYQHRINDKNVLNNLVIEKREAYPKIDVHSITPTDPHHIPNTHLTGKCIVFSGELNLLPEEAYQIAVDAGAILKTAVSKKVDYLILGEVDPRYIGEDGMCGKQRKALELIESGDGKIQIINEQKFLSLATSTVPQGSEYYSGIE